MMFLKINILQFSLLGKTYLVVLEELGRMYFLLLYLLPVRVRAHRVVPEDELAHSRVKQSYVLVILDQREEDLLVWFELAEGLEQLVVQALVALLTDADPEGLVELLLQEDFCEDVVELLVVHFLLDELGGKSNFGGFHLEGS